MRNIAHPMWLHLLSLCSRRGMVYTPYCTLDDAGGAGAPPAARAIRSGPCNAQLATVAFLQDRYAEYRSRDRAAQARQRHRATAVGDEPPGEATRCTPAPWCCCTSRREGKAHYAEFLARHGVDFVDCAFPITPAMTVPGEGHPNGALNARWASCIASTVETAAAS